MDAGDDVVVMVVVDCDAFVFVTDDVNERFLAARDLLTLLLLLPATTTTTSLDDCDL